MKSSNRVWKFLCLIWLLFIDALPGVGPWYSSAVRHPEMAIANGQ
jgi:hypothetical protein